MPLDIFRARKNQTLLKRFAIHLENREGYAFIDLPEESLPETVRFIEKTPKNALRASFLRAILSRTMFAMQNVPSQPLNMGGIRITPLDMEEGISNFDLSLSMKKSEEGLKGLMRYKTNLFKDETITRMLENFQKLLKDIVANPDMRISELPKLAKTSAPPHVEEPENAAYVQNTCPM